VSFWRSTLRFSFFGERKSQKSFRRGKENKGRQERGKRRWEAACSDMANIDAACCGKYAKVIG